MLTTAGSGRATLVAALFAFLLIAVPAQALPRASAFDASRLPAATAELVEAAAVPPGLTESVAVSGLTAPTAVRFAPGGRVVVAEKSGLVKVFDSLTDTTPTVLADLRTNVHDFWDRGLLGLALDPNFTVNGNIYVLYSYNKDPNSTQFPRWPDSCPTPPGATNNGGVLTARLPRLSSTGAKTVLIEDWCQQYPSHSIGSLAVGAGGALDVSGGRGGGVKLAHF